MIAVILDLLRAARGRTGLLFLLGALPVAAAVAGPAYTAAAQRSIVASEVAAAEPGETVLRFTRVDKPEQQIGDGYERLGGNMFATPGFDIVFGSAFEVAPRTVDGIWRLAYRDGVCAHVTIDSGRCATGRGEVMIGFRSAAQLGAGVGDAISFRQWGTQIIAGSPEPTRVGTAVSLSVVGIYRPVDPTAAYWGPVSPFPPATSTAPTPAALNPTGQVGSEPLFGSRATAGLFPLEVPESQTYDLVADPARLTVDWVDHYPAELERLTAKATEIGADFFPGTDALISRIERSRSAVRSLVPWLAATVVPLCWFVIFLAAASSAETRRTELGQIAMRGLPLPHRWWLAGGPDAVAVLAGTPLGLLAGQFVGGAAAPLGDVDLGFDPGVRRFAAAAALGALLAVALAYRAVVTGRAIDLLRKVTRQGGAWRSATIEATVIALAAFAVVEARTAQGPPRGGLATLAPVLLILAGALLVARLLAPVVRRASGWALATGRLAGALAGIELSRRSAPRRAVTLAVLGVALLCFTAVAVDAGRAARAQRAGVELGAARVFDVSQVSGGTLRAAVRTADPEGRWAMAAVVIPAGGSGPATVAADTERLAAVAWPGSVPIEALGRLRPPVAPSVEVTGTEIQVDATVEMPTVDPAKPGFRPGFEPELRAIVQPPGQRDRRVTLGDIRFGRQRYASNLPPCEPGCRLIALEIEPVPATLRLTVHGISQTAPGILSDPARWRASIEDDVSDTTPKLTADASGVTVEMASSPAPQRLVVADVPAVLPVLRTTSAAAARETNTGWAVASPSRTRPTPATAIGARPVLPGVGGSGLLVDMEYLDRAAPMGPGGRTQVWIGPDAPADALTRLSDAGLTVLTETSAADVAALAERRGPALAARYELVTAGFAILLVLLGLGLMAAAERTVQSARGRVLRAQGVRASTLRTAGRHLRLWPALVGLLLGPVLAVAVWAVAGPATPMFLDTGWPDALPILPDPVTLGLVWAACAVPLLTLAVARRRRAAPF